MRYNRIKVERFLYVEEGRRLGFAGTPLSTIAVYMWRRGVCIGNQEGGFHFGRTLWQHEDRSGRVWSAEWLGPEWFVGVGISNLDAIRIPLENPYSIIVGLGFAQLVLYVPAVEGDARPEL
jgi:hypothetical protein